MAAPIPALTGSGRWSTNRTGWKRTVIKLTHYQTGSSIDTLQTSASGGSRAHLDEPGARLGPTGRRKADRAVRPTVSQGAREDRRRLPVARDEHFLASAGRGDIDEGALGVLALAGYDRVGERSP